MSAESLKRAKQSVFDRIGNGIFVYNDLEIRGAGSSGEDQVVKSIKWGLPFNDLLLKTINTLKSADCLNDNFDKKEIEMNLKITALIPEKYLPDVHELSFINDWRLHLYNEIELIEEEIIDRFETILSQCKI